MTLTSVDLHVLFLITHMSHIPLLSCLMSHDAHAPRLECLEYVDSRVLSPIPLMTHNSHVSCSMTFMSHVHDSHTP